MMKLHIWDVQHGSAAYLQTPTGQQIAIDLGVGDISEGDEAVSPLQRLWDMGVRQLDEVIITHPHRDHLDDIDHFSAFNPRYLRRPRHLTEQDIRAGNRPGDSDIIDAYLRIDRQYTGTSDPATNPESAPLAGMDIVCFHPTESARTNLNNQSIVTFLRHAGSTICLPGDNEAPSWRELLKQESFRAWLRATDVFVASHHGRDAGYCADVFDHCKPRLVIVSDGPGCDTSAVNSYHNHASGWRVWSQSSGAGEDRYVLTTRSDGSVVVDFYETPDQRYLIVTKE
jgi:beta-lactamase superfamily II metal-dependent hydrolase